MTRLIAYEDDRFWSAVRADPNFPKRLEPLFTAGVGDLLVSDQEALQILAWARQRPQWDPRHPPLEAHPLATARP
jgi:hypothetical protein